MTRLHFYQIAPAILIGILIGILFGLGVISTSVSLNRAGFAVTPVSSAIETATLSPTATTTFTLPPTATLIPSLTTTRIPRPKPTKTPQPNRAFVEHFLLARPLALDATAPAPNPMYLYGTTELGQYEVHHGADFDRNPVGTPTYAAGDGIVVTAGDDRVRVCGESGKEPCGRSTNYYGLVTVIRLDASYLGKTLFALYGHQDRIDVQVGQRVKRGEMIGAIGKTGIALGPHVHFEIRVGVNDYPSTRNSMLWIAPLPGRGVIAGRYANANGNLIGRSIVDIYRAGDSKMYRETETYGSDEYPDVNSDDELGESFLMSDLPAGEYIVRITGTAYAARVKVEAGKLAWVEFGN